MEKYRDEQVGIYIRPITYDDTENIISWRNNAEVRKHFIYQELFTKEIHENWMKTMVETGKVVQMIICEIGTDRPVGSVYIRDIDQTHHKAEYGMFIGVSETRGKGYGGAAARLMIQYSFEELKLHRLFCRIYAENVASIRSCERAGFVKEAHLRDDVYVNNKYHDIVLLGVLNY